MPALCWDQRSPRWVTQDTARNSVLPLRVACESQAEAFRAAREEGAQIMARTATSDTDLRLQQSYAALPTPDSESSDTQSLQALKACNADGTRKRPSDRLDARSEEDSVSTRGRSLPSPRRGRCGPSKAPGLISREMRRPQKVKREEEDDSSTSEGSIPPQLTTAPRAQRVRREEKEAKSS